MKAGERGLTLVEALVALALLGLLAAGAAALLPLMGRLSTTATAAQRQTDMLARSHDFLRTVLAQARPVSDLRQAGTMPELPMSTDHLGILTRLPDGLGPGGPVLLHLDVERLDVERVAGKPAVLRLAAEPLRPGADVARATLIEGAARISWDYYDAASGSWTTDWAGRPGFPALFRLRVSGTAMGDWPDLVIRPALEQGPLCFYDTVGGQCRKES